MPTTHLESKRTVRSLEDDATEPTTHSAALEKIAHTYSLSTAIATISERSKHKAEFIQHVIKSQKTDFPLIWHKRAYDKKSDPEPFKYICDWDYLIQGFIHPFILLCIAGNLEKIKLALEENEEILKSISLKKEILSATYQGITGFLYAVMHDQIDVAKYLIEKHELKLSAERIVLYIRSQQMLEFLLTCIPELEKTLHTSEILHHLVKTANAIENNDSFIRYLIAEHKLSTHIKNAYEETAFDLAIKSPHTQIKEDLLDLASQEMLEKAALYTASHADFEFFKKIMEKIDQKFNLNPLEENVKRFFGKIFAVQQSNEFIRYLIDIGADINFMDEHENTALCYSRTTESFDLLLETGASIHAVRSDGKSSVLNHFF